MRKWVFAAIAATSVTAARADVFTATFDEFSEGFFSNDLSSGGVHFYAIDQNLGGGDNFTIEWANSSDLGAWFTPPNVLGFGGYVPGSGEAFGRLKSFKFALANQGFHMQSVSMDFWTFLLQSFGNSVTLEGWYQGQLVNSDSYSPGTFSVVHRTLSLPTDDYDEFRILCDGPIDNGVLFADVDNVRIQAQPVPEPLPLLILAPGLLLICRRRRN